MTTLAVLSDIHGNLPALDAVMRDMAQFPIDRVVVAGDLVNWGPFSAQVMDVAVREEWALIRGNNEYYVLDYNTPRAPTEWGDPSRFPLLPWLAGQLDGHWHRTIAAMPDTLSLRFPDAPPIRVVHGSPRSAWESLFPAMTEAELEPLLAGSEETTIIAGHTHLPMDRRTGRWRVLNPGTVGVPVDGTMDARYMLLRAAGGEWVAEFRHVPYDTATLWAEFERQRFRERCGVIGELVRREFATARLWVHPFVRWRARHHPDAPTDQRLLAAFDAVDPWPYIPAAYHLFR